MSMSKRCSISWKRLMTMLIGFTLWTLVLTVLYDQHLYIVKSVSVPQQRTSVRMFDNLLENNRVYQKFNIASSRYNETLNIILIVSTAPKRAERRNAIRDTWWKQCHSTKKVKVKCLFMTDRLEVTHPLYGKLRSETIRHNDIILQKEFKGVRFGDRFLYHMVWAMKNYRFDYFMRLDDDIMLCAERFIQELPLPAPELFHWGWVHCKNDVVRPEESIILLSRGLVERFLLQPEESILCHPLADQMIGAWMNELDLVNIYHHDKRAYHHPPASFTKYFKEYKDHDICDRFISVHGSYPEMMRKLWSLRGEEIHYLNKTLLDHSKNCDYPSFYVWYNFEYTWRYIPKRCIIDPVWDTTKQGGNDGSYGGRQQNYAELSAISIGSKL